MDVRSTGIIGRASAVCINYRKWVGPSIDTTDPSHSEFQVWCSSVAWLWSYSLPKVSPNISKMQSDLDPMSYQALSQLTTTDNPFSGAALTILNTRDATPTNEEHESVSYTLL